MIEHERARPGEKDADKVLRENMQRRLGATAVGGRLSTAASDIVVDVITMYSRAKDTEKTIATANELGVAIPKYPDNPETLTPVAFMHQKTKELEKRRAPRRAENLARRELSAHIAEAEVTKRLGEDPSGIPSEDIFDAARFAYNSSIPTQMEYGVITKESLEEIPPNSYL